jgi:hypothetical protein
LLGSVAGAMPQSDGMTTSEVLVLVLLLLCTALATLTPALRIRLHRRAAPMVHGGVVDLQLGIGTVRGVQHDDGGRLRQVTIDVEAVPGQAFTGRLEYIASDPVIAALRPGSVVLVAFDPVARECLSLPDEIVAVSAAFDRMLIRKGLATAAHLDVIRHGIRTRGVVTAVRPTGVGREDHREVELDLMVRRPHGGQFPARETTLIPVSAVAAVAPGSIVDTYYRPGDESVVAVCVAPG